MSQAIVTARPNGKNVRFECITRTHVGCRRKINEDAMLSRPDLGLWAVADGMGGHDAGRSGQRTGGGHAAVRRCGAGSRLAHWPPPAQAAARGQSPAFGHGRGPAEQRTIGSTVVAMAADARSFACLWVGDSRAYLARDGVLKQLTHDHSLVQQLVDVRRYWIHRQAAQHPNANIITRAVGAAPELDIDSVEGEVLDGDVFLLGQRRTDALAAAMRDFGRNLARGPRGGGRSTCRIPAWLATRRIM